MQGFSGDGGTATNAKLNYAKGVAVDNAGNLFIADTGNHRIRRVDSNGIIETVAGNGTAGYSGDGGAATNAQLSVPVRVAWDGVGNLYISEVGNQRIRKVGTNGIITTVAGNGTAGYSGDGGAATNAALNQPDGLASDGRGNLFFSDLWNCRVRKVDTNGTITTVTGNGSPGSYSGDGAATNAVVAAPNGLALDSAGNLFIPDYNNNRVHRVGGLQTLTLTNISANNLGGYSVVVANASGSVTSSVAALNMPPYIVSPPAHLTLLEGSSAILSVTAQGSGPLSYQWSLNATNIIGATNATYALNQVSTNSAGLYAVTVTNAFGSVTINGTLNVVFISGPPASQIVTAGATVLLSVSLSSPGAFSYQWQLNGTNLPASGLIRTAAGNGTAGNLGDGSAATNARLNVPRGVAVDNFGNLFIADTSNHRIRRVDSNGIITTVAGNGTAGYLGDGGAATNAQLNVPSGVALNAFGDLFIADTSNHRIRRVDSNGIITTVAGNGTAGYLGDGGSATNARLSAPSGVAVDVFGDLFIADSNNNRVREVTVNGVITTVAGSAVAGYFGDGGAAPNARLNAPSGVAVDATHNLFVADLGNSRVREVVGMPVSPSTLFTYVLGNAGSNNAGSYSVIISNTYGSITSTVAIATVILSANPSLNLSASGVTGGGFAINWNNLSAVPPLSYQVQYKTNLAYPYWSNVGTVVTGTIPLMNFTDPIGSDVLRFYRVQFVQ